MRLKAGIGLCALVALLVVGGAAATRSPSASQKAAIVAALRSEQGNVAIQRVVLSSANPSFASMDWGFAHGGLSAKHNTVFALVGGAWKILWTRDAEQPADGACVYVPAAVARDLLSVGCPPAAKLRARPAGTADLAQMKKGFLASKLTPYARTATGLDHVCVSSLDPRWAAGVAHFPSGSFLYIWFKHTNGWAPSFESLTQQGTPPPARVVLSLASCVGYNPADYEV